MVRSKPVILIDSREKRPYDFEGDDAFASIKHTKLDAGDYSLEGLEHIIVIERKASVDELFLNFTKDIKRLNAEFERLKDHKIKVIMIEATCEDVMNPYKYYINKNGLNKHSPKMPVAVVTSGLTNLMLQHNVHIFFGGSKAQSMTRGILLRAYEMYKE